MPDLGATHKESTVTVYNSDYYQRNHQFLTVWKTDIQQEIIRERAIMKQAYLLQSDRLDHLCEREREVDKLLACCAGRLVDVIAEEDEENDFGEHLERRQETLTPGYQ